MVERKTGILISPTIKSVERRILMHQIDRAELLDLERVVAANISLRADGLESLPLAEQAIVEHIGKSLYFAAKYLGLSVPDKVEFLRGQRGVPDYTIDNGYYAAGACSTPKDCPNGLIGYSPYFLKKVADDIEFDLKWRRGRFHHVDSHSTRQLAGLSWHEVFHLYQRGNDRLAFERDVDILSDEGILAWNDTPTEQDAKRFEHKFANGYVQALMQNPLI